MTGLVPKTGLESEYEESEKWKHLNGISHVTKRMAKMSGLSSDQLNPVLYSEGI